MAPIGTLWAVQYQFPAKYVRYLTLSPWILKLILFFPSLFRLNQFAPWEASRLIYQLTMCILRTIRNQSSWPSSPTARSRLSRPRVGSSSSRESLSHVMVSNRLPFITQIAGYIWAGASLKVVLKVMSACLDDLIIIFSKISYFFLSGGNADPYQTAVAGLAPNSGILGGTPEEAALIDQWVHLAENEVETFNNFVRGMCSGRFAYSKPVRHSSSSSILPDIFSDTHQSS